MTKNKCELYEHIFSINSDGNLACEKCEILYRPDYLADVDTHKFAYRKQLKHI